MNRRQIEAAFDELEADNPIMRARVFLKATDHDGATVTLVVDRGEYDLFMEDELLVTRYDYFDGFKVARRFGANFVPFDSILMVELEGDGREG